MNVIKILDRTSALYSEWAELLDLFPNVSIKRKIEIDKRIDAIREELAKLQKQHYDLFFGR